MTTRLTSLYVYLYHHQTHTFMNLREYWLSRFEYFCWVHMTRNTKINSDYVPPELNEWAQTNNLGHCHSHYKFAQKFDHRVYIRFYNVYHVITLWFDVWGMFFVGKCCWMHALYRFVYKKTTSFSDPYQFYKWIKRNTPRISPWSHGAIWYWYSVRSFCMFSCYLNKYKMSFGHKENATHNDE
jgi:hypothetical protein